MKANIEYNVLLQNNGYALIETKGNYIVAANYNPESPFGQQWSHGTYFTFFNNAEVKPKMLAAALECYRLRTESGYISRLRLEELATKFKDGLLECLEEEECNDFFNDECDMTEGEKTFFEIMEIDIEEDK